MTRFESLLLEAAKADWREGERFEHEWNRMVEGHRALGPKLPGRTNPIYDGGVTPPGREEGLDYERK